MRRNINKIPFPKKIVFAFSCILPVFRTECEEWINVSSGEQLVNGTI